jgi:hypothetical protein
MDYRSNSTSCQNTSLKVFWSHYQGFKSSKVTSGSGNFHKEKIDDVINDEINPWSLNKIILLR